MTVLVTGASGHIGANLVRALLSAGRRVRCLVHLHCKSIDGLDVERVEGDILNPDSLDLAMEGVSVVYHLAARISLSMNDIAPVWSVNVDGTRNIVDACLRNNVKRLIHFGSIHALVQEPLAVPVDENRPLVTGKRSTPYDRSKAAGVMEVRKGIDQGLDAVVIYPTGVFGPYDYEPSFFGQAIINIANGTLPALLSGGFDWVDARDVVAGAMAAEAKASCGSSYLLSGHWVGITDIALMISEFTGNDTKRPTVPLWLANAGAVFLEAWSRYRQTRPLYTRASLAALKSNRNISSNRASIELDYNPRHFRETLEDTLNWFAENSTVIYDKNPEGYCRR